MVADAAGMLKTLQTFSLLILLRYVKDTDRWVKYLKTVLSAFKRDLAHLRTLGFHPIAVLRLLFNLCLFLLMVAILVVLLPLAAGLTLLLKLSQITFLQVGRYI